APDDAVDGEAESGGSPDHSGRRETAGARVGQQARLEEVELVADPLVGEVEKDRHGERKKPLFPVDREPAFERSEMRGQVDPLTAARPTVLVAPRPGKVVLSQEDSGDPTLGRSGDERVKVGRTVGTQDDPFEPSQEPPG